MRVCLSPPHHRLAISWPPSAVILRELFCFAGFSAVAFAVLFFLKKRKLFKWTVCLSAVVPCAGMLAWLLGVLYPRTSTIVRIRAECICSIRSLTVHYLIFSLASNEEETGRTTKHFLFLLLFLHCDCEIKSILFSPLSPFPSSEHRRSSSSSALLSCPLSPSSSIRV